MSNGIQTGRKTVTIDTGVTLKSDAVVKEAPLEQVVTDKLNEDPSKGVFGIQSSFCYSKHKH